MVEQWMRDTSPEAFDVFLDVHRRMSEGQRARSVFEMSEMQHALVESSIRSTYPKADEREIFLRSTARRLGRELMVLAYGWDPVEHP